jgi:Homeodomain-like domain-containing protein
MQERDGRSIPGAALEVLRERAVAMHEAGNAQLAIARALGVHKNTVCRWLKGWRVAGAAALKAKSVAAACRSSGCWMLTRPARSNG